LRSWHSAQIAGDSTVLKAYHNCKGCHGCAGWHSGGGRGSSSWGAAVQLQAVVAEPVVLRGWMLHSLPSWPSIDFMSHQALA
jgi:hypothetical protein